MDPDLFRADIEAKPAALRALADRLDEADPWPLQGYIKRLILLGMGSSRYAAEAAAGRLRALGIDAVAEYASARASYPPTESTHVLAISATGGSRETLDAIEPYAGKCRVIAVTNDPASTLAGRADSVVPMLAGVEAGGVACRTYQHTLVLFLDLISLLAGRPRGGADLARRAADAVEDLLDRRDAWLPTTLSLLDGPDGVYALAPVERFASAAQSALMVREGPRRAATGCETGDWSHVDVYLAKTLAYRALMFPGSRYDGQALEWLHGRGSTIVAVGGDVPGADQVIRYAGDTDDDVRLLTEVTVAELVAAEWWLRADSRS